MRSSSSLAQRVRHATATLGLALCATVTNAAAAEATPPPVLVTLRADAASIPAGATTVVHAFAQVAPALEPRADRIFTWNLDLLVLAPEVLALDATSLERPKSDRDPVLGSVGIVDGSSLLGVRDGFLNLERAGVTVPVELFSIRVRALAPGRGSLRVRPGTIGADGSPDFQVLPSGDEDPWTGGDYTAASVEITVTGGDPGGPGPRLAVEQNAQGVVRVTVQGQPGEVVALDESPSFGDGAVWRRVGQSPGTTAVFVHETTPDGPTKFFRGVRLTTGNLGVD